MTRLRLILAVCACVMLAAVAVASANPATRGFNSTYPHASRLCAKVANGHAPKKLAASSAQVAAACAELKTSFTSAQNSYTTAVAPLKQQATSDIAALRATCRAARANHDPAACKAARKTTRAQLAAIRAQVHAAAKTYHKAVNAARKAFWSKIAALRGGSTEQQDTSVGPGPTTMIPSDSTINRA